MDKNLHHIEDLFRKGLEDNEDTPSQKAWDGIEKKLDKDNVVSIKRKYDLLKKVALLLLLLLAGLSVYIWKNQDKNSVKPGNGISSIKNETKPKYKPLTRESGTINLQKRVDSLKFDKSDNANQITRNVKPEKSLNSDISDNLSNTSIKKNKIKSAQPGESVLPAQSNSEILKKFKSVKRTPDEVVEIKIHDQTEDKQPDVVNPAGIQFDNTLPANQKFSSIDIGDIKNNTAVLFATKESLYNIALFKINPLIPIEKTIVRKPSIKPTKQSRFAITAFYSPDIVFHNFVNSGLGNSNNTNFNVPEAESHASTLGALIDYAISKDWGLQSGVTLVRSDFELEYDKPETAYAQPDNSGAIQYKLATPLGDAFVKPSFSNNPIIGDSIFSKSTAYNLQYIGIPLAVKYNFNKRKFTFNALGGISANFLMRRQLTTELEYGNDNDTETTNKIYGLKPFYFSGLAGIGVDYNIYKEFSLSFSPTFRFALNSINSNVRVASFPNSFGFVLGLKMKM